MNYNAVFVARSILKNGGYMCKKLKIYKYLFWGGSLFQEQLKTKLVCTILNAFIMLNQNIKSKMINFETFSKKFEKHVVKKVNALCNTITTGKMKLLHHNYVG